MQGLGNRMRFVRTWILGGLTALFASLLIAAGAPAAPEEATIISLAPGIHALAVTVGPDGNLWFAAGSSAVTPEGQIGRVTPNGQVTEFPLHTMSSAQGIVTGPDGNLWFTEYEAGRIGRITTGGEIVKFPLPETDSQPSAIAAGPDGNLWFTEYGANRIGRITPAGAITEFPLRHGRGPSAIAAAPDGNLWFTEYGANRIGRITPIGEISEFRLPGTDRRPNAIAAGLDGNLWFTEAGASRIGRITTAGAIAQFPIPSLSGTGAIAAAPDGNLWFTTFGQVGSISPSGRVTQMSCLKIGCRLPPVSIAVGPGGGLWAGTTPEYPYYSGGGTVINITLTQPGYIAKLSPPPVTAEIGPNARSVVGRRTDLRLSCEAAAGCEGELQLTRLHSAFPGHPGSSPSRQILAQRRYLLAAGESRRVPLRLTRGAAKLLSGRRSLSAWATAGVETHLEAAELIVLHPRARDRHGPAA
jgi:streptogramin lyase